MTQRSRKEYIETIRKRYQKAVKKTKGRILDEVQAVLACHCKAAIRLLNPKPKPITGILSSLSGRKKHYTDPQLSETLVFIWRKTNLEML